MIALEPVKDVALIDPWFHFEREGELANSLLSATFLASELKLFKLIIPLVEFLVTIVDDGRL